MEDLSDSLHNAQLESLIVEDIRKLLLEHAVGLVCDSQCSDAPFMFSPQQIAMEAIVSAIVSVQDIPTGSSSELHEHLIAWRDGVFARHGKLKEQVQALRERATYQPVPSSLLQRPPRH